MAPSTHNVKYPQSLGCPILGTAPSAIVQPQLWASLGSREGWWPCARLGVVVLRCNPEVWVRSLGLGTAQPLEIGVCSGGRAG